MTENDRVWFGHWLTWLADPSTIIMLHLTEEGGVYPKWYVRPSLV